MPIACCQEYRSYISTLHAVVNRNPTPLDSMADFNHRGAIGEFFRELNLLLADS